MPDHSTVLSVLTSECYIPRFQISMYFIAAMNKSDVSRNINYDLAHLPQHRLVAVQISLQF